MQTRSFRDHLGVLALALADRSSIILLLCAIWQPSLKPSWGNISTLRKWASMGLHSLFFLQVSALANAGGVGGVCFLK